MNATILNKKTLHGINSASGLEYFNGKLYIIGDDSKWLYECDSTGTLLKKHLMFESVYETAIPKNEKPDLETLTFIKSGGIDYLLTLGSGSKKGLRDKGFLVDLHNYKSTPIDFSSIFSELTNSYEIVGNNKLNIEGLAASESKIALFTRGNISGKNLCLSYNLNEFLNHIITKTKLNPPKIDSYSLPSVGGWLSGFSGASFSNTFQRFLFTATVEATSNEIDDGTTFGSFVGIIKDSNMKIEGLAPIMENGNLYKGKVESISIINETSESIIAFAVTDSDGGESELLQIQISL